jgi:PAS domain S-box-containing protein
MMISDKELFAASILIVDDQESNVLLLMDLLTQAGYTNVSFTMEPTTVCAAHRLHRYDLILLDLQMPAMDGFQVMEALKANLVDDYLQVIVLTAQPGHKLAALKAGAKDFISKPFDLVEVKARIRNMLEVRLLYKRLGEQNAILEQAVIERTAELRESEARYRQLTELASDWYWEQDQAGQFTKTSGPVLDMLGLSVDSLSGEPNMPSVNAWNEEERAALHKMIADRRPFLDFSFSRTSPDGAKQHYRVSGEPMFDRGARFIGYRGVGVSCSPPASDHV